MQKREFYREYAIRAFAFWASKGCPSTEEYYAELEELAKKSGDEDGYAAEHIGEIQDITACCETFRLLKENGRGDACDAVRAVYMAEYGVIPGRKEVSRRVIAFSQSYPASERTVYYWLRLAMRTFAECRALRIE